MASKDLVFRFIGVDAGAGREFDHIAGKASHAHGIIKSFGVGMVATAATVAGASLEMADKFENAHARLEQAFRNVHRPAEQFSAQINQAQKTLERYGFTNAEVQESLGNLVTATRSPEKAFRDIGLAADLARYKHIGLAEAATTLAKAEAGQLRPLKQLGIDLPIAAGGAVKVQQAKDALAKAEENYNQILERQHGKHKLSVADHIALQNAQEKVKAAQEKVNSTAQTGTRIQQELAKVVGGQAAAASGTLAGKQARLRAQFTDMGVKLGTALMPVLMKTADVIEKNVVPAMEHFGRWASHNKRPIEDIAKALAAIAVLKFTVGKLNDFQKFVKGASSVLTGSNGGAAGALTGRGSPENPMYVVSLNGKGGPGLPGAPVPGGKGLPGEEPIPGGGSGIPGVGSGKLSFVKSIPLYGVGANSDTRQMHVPQRQQLETAFAQVKTLVHSNPAAAADYKANTPAGLKELQAWVAKWQSTAAAGGTSIGDTLNTHVDHAIRSRLAGAAGRDARVAVAQIARNAAEAAGSGGETVGEALGNGVAVGILVHKAKVANAAGQLTNAALGKIRQLGDISSPSKKTTYLGQMLAAGLERGMHMGAKGVSDTARQLMGTILGNFQASASLGNLSTTGTDALGASGSVPITAASIAKFLGGQRTQDRTVVRNLAMARKRGVGAGLLQEIAQMEPTQGAAYAAALAHATPAQVRAINSDEKAIAQYGRQAGGLVTLSQRTIDQLSRGIAHSVRHTPIHVSVSKIDRHHGVAVVISP